jgi:hypothetical protein
MMTISCRSICSVTWLIAGEGGGDKIYQGHEELYFTKESNLKEGKIGPIKRKFLVFFSLSIFYLPLFNSVTEKAIPRLKNIGGHLTPHAPPPPPKLRLWVLAVCNTLSVYHCALLGANKVMVPATLCYRYPNMELPQYRPVLLAH